MTVYHKAKRAKEKKLNKKKITICILLLIIILAIIYLIASNRLFDLFKKQEVAEEVQEETQEPEEVVEEVVEEVDVSDIPDNMGNYKVLGKLVIDKIELEKNILAICDDEALKLSATKLYGPDLNESGNFCVSGHNWKGMLKRMSEMQVGDTLYTVNKETKTKVNYKIYNIYTCVPEDLSCLKQNDDGLKEITIITCNPGGATRLICKAREI